MSAADHLLPPEPVARPWSWEGKVQDAIVADLEREGWTIVHAVNTLSHETGKDIVAERDGKTLWVTVKGFPLARIRPSPRPRPVIGSPLPTST